MSNEDNIMQKLRERLDDIGKVTVWDVATREQRRYWAVDAIAELRAGNAVLDETDLPAASAPAPAAKPAPKPAAKPAPKAAAAAEPKAEG